MRQAVALCRAHRYPPTTKEMAEKSRGIGAHTDFGALTLLLQDDCMRESLNCPLNYPYSLPARNSSKHTRA